MSTAAAAAEQHLSDEDARDGLLHDPFGIVSSTNPAKRIKVDHAPANTIKAQVDAAPHVLAEVRTQVILQSFVCNILCSRTS